MADTVAISFPLPPTGPALNAQVKVNLDAIVTGINNISNGLTNFNQLNLGTPSVSSGFINWYNASNAEVVQLVAGSGKNLISDNVSFNIISSGFALTAYSEVGMQIRNTTDGQTMGAFLNILATDSTVGDARIRFQVAFSSGQNWTTGIDQSDSSSYKISSASALGTSDRLTITTGGLVTVPGTFGVTGASTFTAAITVSPVTNQIVLGATRTVTLTAPTPASLSRVVTIPDLVGDYSVVGTIGTQTIGGSKTFSSAVAVSATSNHIVLSTSSNTLTLSAATQATSARTWTVPDVSGNGTFAALEGTQTFSGSKTFSSAVAVTATSNHIVLSTSSNTLTVSAATQATSARTWTIPDVSGNGTFAALEGTQTFSGAKTYSATLTMSGATIAMGSNKITGLGAATTAGDAIRYEQLFTGDVTLTGNLIFNPTTKGVKGTTTNDSTAAGNVGEYIESLVSTVTSVGTTGQFFDATSMTLTAGDWEVTGIIVYTRNGATFTSTDLELGISTTTGNSATGLVVGSNYYSFTGNVAPTTFNSFGITVPGYRMSLSGSTIVYLKGSVDVYTAGTPQYRCRLSARRLR